MSRVLKERRIFWDRRFAWELCVVPSERTDFTTCSQGFTLGWYAMPRWGTGPTTTPDAGDAPLGYGADNDTGCRRCLVRHGTTIKSVMEMGFWVPPMGHGADDQYFAGDAPSQYGTDGDTHGGDAPLGYGADNDTGCR